MTLKRSLSLALVMAASLGLAQAAGWQAGAPMEDARAQVRAAVVDGEIYVAGGSGLSGPNPAFDVYDPASDHWYALESMPEGRAQFGLAAIGSEIFAAGGYSSWEDQAPTASVAVFRVDEGRWSARAPMPAPRVGHGMAAAAGKLYVLGGQGAEAAKVWRYDPPTDKWESFGQAMPEPRAAAAVAVNGQEIYVIGGRDAAGAPSARVDVFNTATGGWRRAPNLPVAGAGMTADFIGGRLHVAGGFSAAKTLADHRVLSGESWSSLADLPTARHGLTSAAVNGKWFVMGGGAGAGLLAIFTETDVVEVYTP